MHTKHLQMFRAEDLNEIRQAWPLLEEHLPDILVQFYEHLDTIPDLAAVRH